jgi:hypothetical protein
VNRIAARRIAQKLALLSALGACSSPTSKPPPPNPIPASDSTAPTPDQIHEVGDGTVISRRLLALPEAKRADAARAVARATPAREIVELPFKSSDAPARVGVYRAAAPAHGIVFYGGAVSDDNREIIIQLLASRGYHVVVSDMLEPYVVNDDLATWTTMTLGSLPIACVNVHRCQLDVDSHAGSVTDAAAGAPPRLAAIVDDDIMPANLCHVGCAGPVPELVLFTSYPRGLVSTNDRLVASCAEKRERARAVVSGVTFRGNRALRDLATFEAIETFLAQHLGGRAEPVDIAELRRAAMRVTYGLDKLTALAGYKDLELAPLDEASRANIEAGIAELLASVRSAVSRGCPGLTDRLQRLPIPDTLTPYCQSDELRLLANRYHDDALAIVQDAGCDDALSNASPFETLMDQCER